MPKKDALLPKVSWPPVKVVQAAVVGRMASIFTPEGTKAVFKGFMSSSDTPWIAYSTPDGGVFCTRCSAMQLNPAPPANQGGPGEAPKVLFSPFTRDYAQYLLTTSLYPFAKEHVRCKKNE